MSEEDKEPFGREAQQKVKAAQDMRQAVLRPGLNDVQAELDVFKTLLHPNVAVCYGVASTSDSVGLLLELGQGSVAQFLRQNPLSEPAPRQKLFLRWQLSCDWTV